MNSAGRSIRARRGQVMIVGHGVNLPAGCRWPRDPKQVESFFDALGELTVATAASPISTVLVNSRFLRELDGEAQLALDALHRVDPAVRVVMIDTNHAGRTSQAITGIDDVINAPLTAQNIADLFDEDVAQVESPVPQVHVVDEPVSEPAKPQAKAEATPKTPREVSAAKEPAATPAPAPPREADIALPLSPEPPRSNAPLGDTDLVEAVLNSPHGIESLALQLIIEQTGWTDLQLLTDQPPQLTGVEVTHAGHVYGMLASTLATSQQLQPWAQWLARWLTMDRSYREHRTLAYRDELTGAWNRRFFNTFLAEAIARGARERRPVTVMVFDIDNFKTYNDQYGHDAGDEILRETVRLMLSVIRQGDRVCRIGGDEFAVIFADRAAPRQPGSTHPDSVEVIAKRFQDRVCSMCFPKLGMEAPGTLSISAGLATYPWDGSTPQTLLRHADQLALESKRKGKNALTFGPGAQRVCGNQD